MLSQKDIARVIGRSTLSSEQAAELMAAIKTADEARNNERNVSDRFRFMDTESIRDQLATEAAPAVAVCMNLSHDFNKSSILRALNAFNLKELWLIGRSSWDRRGAVGTQHYSTVKKSADIAPVIENLKKDGYTVLAVDNYETATDVAHTSFPEKTAFVFGEEQLGLSDEVIAMCDGLIYIKQYGSVRSLNVAQAAAVIFHEYRTQHEN